MRFSRSRAHQPSGHVASAQSSRIVYRENLVLHAAADPGFSLGFDGCATTDVTNRARFRSGVVAKCGGHGESHHVDGFKVLLLRP
jgi:hypothetical protein